MNKKVFVALALVALVAAGCKSKTEANVTVDGDTRANAKLAADGEESVSDNFFGLMSGKSRQCTWELKKPDGTTSGTGMVYAANGKVRSTVHFESGESATDANAVMKDGKVYSWVSLPGMATMGFTMDQDQAKELGAQATAEQQKQAEQFRSKMDLRCKPWSVDQSKFDLPADVNFQSMTGMGEMMQGMMASTTLKGMPSIEGMPKGGKIPTPEEIKAMQQIQLKYQNQVQVGQ